MWTDGANLERDAAATGRTGAMVNGAFIELEPGLALAETAMALARDAGYGKFRVYLNGSELEPEDCPEVIEDGDVLKVMAFDVAG